MGTSLGGGCCDCGDVEAWKSEPFCETHLLGTQVCNKQDVRELIKTQSYYSDKTDSEICLT